MSRKTFVAGEPFEALSDGSREATPTATAFPPLRITRGVEVVAYDTNTEPVYVSRRRNVTADETSTGGFRLIPGAAVFFPTLSMQSVYLITPTTNQRVAFIGY